MNVKENMQAFVDHVCGMKERFHNGEDVYQAEFQSLKYRSVKYRKEKPSKHGELEINMKKNRYKDILPFDETRVALPEIADVPGSDYINANFIRGLDHETKAYIAAQGPLPHTVNDFWRMLWHYQIGVVVMTCRLVEMTKPKCEQYWADQDEERSFGDITVTLSGQTQVSQNVILREICGRKGNEERKIHQYHYNAWPDHGIPTSPLPIIKMMADVRQLQPHDDKPIVLHCSAGCGRTGAVIVIDYVRRLIQSEKLDKSFMLFDLIDEMRQQRAAIVQTRDQYEFVHNAAYELVHDEMQRKFQDYSEHLYENVYLEGEKAANIPDKSLGERPGKKGHKQSSGKHEGDRPVPGRRSYSPERGRNGISTEKQSPQVRSKNDTSDQSRQGEALTTEDQSNKSAANKKIGKVGKQTSQDGGVYERVKPGTVSSAKKAFMLTDTAVVKQTTPENTGTDVNTHMKQPTHTKEEPNSYQITKPGTKFDSPRSPVDDGHESEMLKNDSRENHQVDENKKIGYTRNTESNANDVTAQLNSLFNAKHTQPMSIPDRVLTPKTESSGTTAKPEGRKHSTTSEKQEEDDGAYAIVADPKPKRKPRAHAYEEIDDIPTRSSDSGVSRVKEQSTQEDEAYAVVGPKLTQKTRTSESRNNSEDADVPPPVLPDRTAASFQLIDEGDPLDVAETASSGSHGSMESIDQKHTGSSDHLGDGTSSSGGQKLGKLFKFMKPGKKRTEETSKQPAAVAKPGPPQPPTPVKPAPPPASAKPVQSGKILQPADFKTDLEERIRQTQRDHIPTFEPSPRVHHMQDISYPNRPFKTKGPRETPKHWQKKSTSGAEAM
ncbi:tyrosine-protein phosphatase non-receptor type 12-like isoform X2 [Ptychodera flava]|uniref:tyrosine-protein phosphatase non-receptor type 12-like isoform X2 n=1 Tax=Ptychodera flava TaxID=63121 RepID=UPI00396A0236